MFRTTCRIVQILTVAAVLSGRAAAQDFKPLFDGTSFDGWKFVFDPKAEKPDPAKTWTIKDGVIQCHGFPHAYLHTVKSYGNYVVRYDWMYPVEQPEKTTLNTGLLMHIQEPHGIWPKSVEAQGRLRDHGKLFFNGGVRPIGTPKFDAEAQARAIKPQGEWNTTEATCLPDGTVKVKVNGVDVASGQTALTSGMIGFQCEGAEVHFKNIKIKEMK